MLEKIDISKFEEEVEFDYPTLLARYSIDVNRPIERPPIALSIGYYDYKGIQYPIPFASYGDFSCLVGASKSMKTFLKSLLVATYIGGQANNYFISARGHNTKGKYILDIDTEQSKYHTQRASKRVIEMVGSEYEYYRPFSLRESNPIERTQFIEWLINESEFKGKIGLIAIDGAADLVSDINDLKECSKLVGKLLKWTTISDAHIITVLHRNFGSEKPTGHLGSTILKKAETVAFVERDGHKTIVTSRYTRNIPFDEFEFSLNDNHLPVVSNPSI
ncbi:P-loop NTPase family protein [Pareuzebyella sediminis]|uniref:hypothetical protein n=1 Tax=Pareuzebyella sediminis TaxID=2607998 RepID=UPI0011F0315B|nr:hypothetical protein [Pareuzebyella sediminis]